MPTPSLDDRYDTLLRSMAPGNLAQGEGYELSNALSVLIAVLEFLGPDARTAAGMASLAKLGSAMHDLSRGLHPSLLRPIRPSDIPDSRPTDLSFHYGRASVVQALRVLLAAGLSRREASEVLTKELSRADIKDTTEPNKHPNGKPITARMVLNWRDEVNGRGPASTKAMLRHFQSCGATGSRLSRQDAMSNVASIIEKMKLVGF